MNREVYLISLMNKELLVISLMKEEPFTKILMKEGTCNKLFKSNSHRSIKTTVKWLIEGRSQNKKKLFLDFNFTGEECENEITSIY